MTSVTFNVVTWNLVFRPIATLIIALLATVLLWMSTSLIVWTIRQAFDLEGPIANFGPLVWFLVFLLVAIVAQFPSSPETVPETKLVALVTWFGMPISGFFPKILPTILRETGHYGWTGGMLGFGRTSTILDEKKGGFTDERGFIKYGPIPFRIWDRGDSSASKLITAPAKNRANVQATLTLILQIIDPKKMLDSDDPALDIGDRARQEYREMARCFVDTDLAALQEATGKVLTGTPLITSFLPKAKNGHKQGAMITDTGDRAMFRLAANNTDEAILQAIEEFTQEVFSRADPILRAEVSTQDASGNTVLKTDIVRVENPIDEVTTSLGMEIVRTTFGDIVFSEPVQEAANRASAETDERIAQLASADTQKEARKRRLPDEEELKNPAWETAMVIAAAEDDKKGNVKILHVTGGDNKLTRAAAVAGQQIGGNS